MKVDHDFKDYVELAGSHKSAPPASRWLELDKSKHMSVSLVLRPKSMLPDLMKGNSIPKPLTHKQLWTNHGAFVDDIKVIQRFAQHYHLTVNRMDINQRIVELRGTILQLEKAFHVDLQQYGSSDENKFVGRKDHISIPKSLKDIVSGVFGLDTRPIATPKFRFSTSISSRTAQQGFNPNTLADIYNFPKATGKNQAIAIIELGGGFRANDISAYFRDLGLKTPKVIDVSVDGAANDPSNANSADAEVMLDIEVAGAVAPCSTLVVYFAPNTDKGFLDAVSAAVHDNKNKPSVISISWGSAEVNWTQQALNAFNAVFQEAAVLGITICAAAGDQGSSDGVRDGLAHVDFPSSSPYVVACGGTTLVVNDNKAIQSETVWHDAPDSATGGGISDVFNVPTYQEKTGLPVSVNSNKQGRGIPDVAAVADPVTGYNVLVDGQKFVIGGTSAVAPLMAGLVARINEKLNKKIGFIHPVLYSHPDACRDITEGDNITTTDKGYKASSGWDACTGNGVPDGSKLLQLF